MARTHFGCDSCARPIAPSDPRIRCLECPEYDLCADCAIGERFTQAHAAAHSTLVFKISGTGTKQGVLANTRIIYVSLAVQAPFIAYPEDSAPVPALPSAPRTSPPPPPPPPPTQHISIPQTLPGSQRISTASALSSQPSYTSPLSAPPDVSEATLPREIPASPPIATSPRQLQHMNRMPTPPEPSPRHSDGGYYTPQQDGASGIGGYTPPPRAATSTPSPPPRDGAYSTPPHEGTEPVPPLHHMNSTSTPPAPSPRTSSVSAISSVGASAIGMAPRDPPQQGGTSRIGGYTPPPRDGGYGTPPQEASTEPVRSPPLQHVNGTTPPAPSSRTSSVSAISSVGGSAPRDDGYYPQQQDRASGIGGYTPPPRAGAPSPPPRAVAPTTPPRAVAHTPPPLYAPAQEASTEPVRGWGPFFAEDMSPTPLFSQLMETIFTYLDTGRTGYLTPETYSRFLVNQGYVGSENIWNANLIASLGQTKKEAADAALKRTYDTLGIDYILHTRAPERPAAVASPTLSRTFKSVGTAFVRSIAAPAPASSSTMPALTRKGFADLTAVALLSDPARAWGCFAGVLRMYEVPQVRAWGLLPREVLPLEADPRMLERVAHRAAVAKGQRQQARTDTILQNFAAVEGAANTVVGAANTVVGTANMMVHNLVKVEGAVAGAATSLELVNNTLSIVSNIN